MTELLEGHERVALGHCSIPLVEDEHLRRYEWAAGNVQACDVLDAACGSGYGSRLLLELGAKSVIGVDVFEGAIEFAARTYAVPGLRYIVDDAEALASIPDKHVDRLVSFETIEHLRNPRAFVRAAARVLRPGGQLLLSTPDRRLASVMYAFRGRPTNAFHVQEFTVRSLTYLLREHFEDLEVFGQAFVPRPLVWFPVQATAKLLGYTLFARSGGREWIRRHYHVGSGLEVQASRPGIARFWVVRARVPGKPRAQQ